VADLAKDVAAAAEIEEHSVPSPIGDGDSP
jgi:hypothetical protein